VTCVDDREAFLRQANIAVLATADAQGRPHAAPVWYFYEDGVFTISTDRNSRKHKNVSANPSIALTIDKRDLPYFAVIAQGRAELGPMLTPEERLRLAIRYLGEERGRRYVEHTKSEDSITILLRPEKVIEYHGRLQPPS
jgi:PPOX class probable F420-dependent enzyme